MALKLITAPTAEPVTVAEVRAHCRIDSTAEDSLLATYIAAARQLCEETIGRALMPQTWEQTLDAFPAGEIKLLKTPVASVVSVVYVDANGTEQTMPSTDYVLDAETEPGWLLPADGLAWPATDDVINAVRIRFVAGYPHSAAVPELLKVWIYATVGAFVTQREALDTTGRVTGLPERFIDRLLDPYRVYG